MIWSQHLCKCWRRKELSAGRFGVSLLWSSTLYSHRNFEFHSLHQSHDGFKDKLWQQKHKLKGNTECRHWFVFINGEQNLFRSHPGSQHVIAHQKLRLIESDSWSRCGSLVEFTVLSLSTFDVVIVLSLVQNMQPSIQCNSSHASMEATENNLCVLCEKLQNA